MDSSKTNTLANLTRDFVDLLKASDGKELDVGAIAQELKAQKRRIYDVTNVLAGIGVIEKCGKGRVRWIGENNKVAEHEDLRKLLEREAEIDRISHFVSNALIAISQSADFENYAWVTEEDVMKLVPDDDLSIFALRGPPDLELEISDEDESGCHRLFVQRSSTGEIDWLPIGKGELKDLT
jgi:hypothetical protein